MEDTQTFPLIVKAVSAETDRVRLLELARADGGDLPAFTAGAHIDLTLGPSRLVRQYSLLNDASERRRYLIAVAREPRSRGGSDYLHDEIEVGNQIIAGGPRNHFALHEQASHSVLIAGGIGVTPIWCMAQRLEAIGASWELHYAAPSPDQAPLLATIQAMAGERLNLYFSRMDGGRRVDPEVVLAGVGREGVHYYCCGPQSLLDSFVEATAGLPQDHVHVEHFSPAAPPAIDGGFTLVLAKSRMTIDIPPGQSILETLKQMGLQASYSCSEGVCGSCETVVLEGLPDHRDSVLTEAERASNRTMMICCSGSKTAKLVLDM